MNSSLKISSDKLVKNCESKMNNSIIGRPKTPENFTLHQIKKTTVPNQIPVERCLHKKYRSISVSHDCKDYISKFLASDSLKIFYTHDKSLE
jgi:hypothetical protein